MNWGKLHPSSVVNANEWTQSEYTPEDYNDLSGSQEGESLGITGTAQPNYVVKSVYDPNVQQFKNHLIGRGSKKVCEAHIGTNG